MRASGPLMPARGRPSAVARAYVAPDAAAISTPATGCGPVTESPAAALTSTRPPSAASRTRSRLRPGSCLAATLSATVSSTGARPSATTVETVTPTATTAAKYSAW